MLNAEEELKNVENTLRDFLTYLLDKEYGKDWINHLKISQDRIAKWKERQEIEHKRLNESVLESRLIYYADFYDLRSIIDKHWNEEFKKALLDKKAIFVFLEELEKLRDPNAHRRELFDYQKHLIIGLSGEIRTRIIKYRGKRIDMDDYFPVVESVTDSLGISISNPVYAQTIINKNVVRVGDSVEIAVFATDPQGDSLLYSIERIGPKNWVDENKKTIKFSESDIGKTCDINVMIKTRRPYHAYSDFDDYVMIRYTVLPK